MVEKKLVNDPITRLMDKIGITGVAAGVFTLLFGIFLIFYNVEWVDVRIFIGLYFLFVGLINIFGYIYSMYSQHRVETTYIEMETLKTKDFVDDERE